MTRLIIERDIDYTEANKSTESNCRSYINDTEANIIICDEMINNSIQNKTMIKGW